MGGTLPTATKNEEPKMTYTNDFTAKIFAAVGAIAFTATLLVSSFANPNATSFTTLLV